MILIWKVGYLKLVNNYTILPHNINNNYYNNY